MRFDESVRARIHVGIGLLAGTLVACAASSRAGFANRDDAPDNGDGGARGFVSSDDSGPPAVDGGTPWTGGGPSDAGSPYAPPDAPSARRDAGPPCDPLVDDMEHGNGSILPSCGRHGYWYTYNDATDAGSQVPRAGAPLVPDAIDGGRGVSAHAVHTSGSGFSGWGAGVAFDLNSAGGGATKLAYDASAYSGIVFWARVGPGSATSLRVNIADRNTEPLGGVCAPAAKCNDHFGTTVSLTTSWARYSLNFDDAVQLGWGMPQPHIVPSVVYAVQFQMASGAPFDLWIDDVAFLP